MKKIRLVFGTYNSQPLGTSDADIENAYQRAYKPFLTTLYNLPEVFLTLHYSGILLQWFEDHHPEFLMLLNDMVKRKQIELLGGAFFEPILPLIPMADRIGQIEALTTFLRKRFGKRPRGCWVPERVWEPGLASMFNASGMDFVFLDDWHFHKAELNKTDSFAPCYTEDQGKLVVVYPICSEFRRFLSTGSPQDAVDRLIAHCSEDEDKTLVIMEDGADLGLIEGSHEVCYKQGGLSRFLESILEQKDHCKLINPAKFIKYTKPEKKAYFTCTSYEQMMNWSAPLNMTGGHFRQFLTKYPESNLMYSKMLYTNLLVNQIRGDKYRKKAAKEELWKGQSNTAYWFGSNGGIYSNHLRKSVYRSLLEAEKTTHEKGLFIPSIITTDFDMDGKVEYLYQGFDMNAYVHVKGGILFELDFLPVDWNYLDTMGRYAEDNGKETDKGGVDLYLRRAFIDHIFDGKGSIEDFQKMRYRELGNFIDGVYEVLDLNREKNSLDLAKQGKVETKGGKAPLHIKKKYVFKRTSIDVYYVLKNSGETALSIIFGSEINLGLPAPQDGEYKILFDGEGAEKVELSKERTIVEKADKVIANDLLNAVVVTVGASKQFELWALPMETDYPKSRTSEKQYQGTCILPRWAVSLKPDETWETTLSINLAKD